MDNIEILENPSKEELKIATLLLGFDVVNSKLFKNGFMGNPLIRYGLETGGLKYTPVYSQVYELTSDYRYSDDGSLVGKYFSRNYQYLNSVITEDRVFMEKLIVLMIKCGFTAEQAFYVLCRDSNDFLSKDKKVLEKKVYNLENQFSYKLEDYLIYLRVGWGRGKVEEIQEKFISDILSVDLSKYDLAIELLGKEGEGFFKYIKKRKPRVVKEKQETVDNKGGLEKKLASSSRVKKSTSKASNKKGLSTSSVFGNIE